MQIEQILAGEFLNNAEDQMPLAFQECKFLIGVGEYLS